MLHKSYTNYIAHFLHGASKRKQIEEREQRRFASLFLPTYAGEM